MVKEIKVKWNIVVLVGVGILDKVLLFIDIKNLSL